MMDGEGLLILGHTGRLGGALADLAPAALVIQGGDLVAAGGRDPARDGAGGADTATRFALMARHIGQARPHWVVNCTGHNAVDRAQTEPAEAWAVNADGVEALARACAAAGSRLLHFSTDYVFDGTAGRPYRETDPPRPLNEYGRGKLAGEERVLAHPSNLVVRTAWLFGGGRPGGFLQTVLARGRQGGGFPVVADQVGSPTYVRDLAPVVLELLAKGVRGLLHAVNAGRASRLELARRALELAGMDPGLAQPVSAAQYGAAAPRPAYSVLDCARLARLLGGPMPTWLDGLRRHLAGAQGGTSCNEY